MQGDYSEVPTSIVSDIRMFQYRERMHLSYAEMLNEPIAEIERAFTIWSLERERDKFNSKKQGITE